MNICVVSYNARGLRVGHRETDKSHRVVVDKLMERCDILCVQETFLANKTWKDYILYIGSFMGRVNQQLT